MLHEILLSLAGNPSPLLTAPVEDGSNPAGLGITTPERQLIANCAQLSDLNTKLQSYSSQIRSSHPSMICRAAATAIETEHLRAFQRRILEVEEGILSEDSSLVGAYKAVPLTAVVGEFTEWGRRLQWLWEIVQFILRVDEGKPCAGARLIDRLRKEMQTGYEDIEAAAVGLVRAAEMAWLKQAAAWILYGRTPGSGVTDFFIQKSESNEYALAPDLLPGFVTPAAASSMLFVGRALNHPKVRIAIESGPAGRELLSSQLRELSKLTHPINSEHFSRTISLVRLALSKKTLKKLLPLDEVCSTLTLFREFFLLGRGEFAMTLTYESDEKIRSRWRRQDNMAYEKRDAMGNVVIKQGEVARVMARVWATLGSIQGLHADEDEGLEQARDLLRLQLTKSKDQTPLKLAARASSKSINTTIADTPFRNLLFSVPTVLSIPDIPSPLDMFLSQSDVQIYSAINSYLLSIKRAHIRLTDLWKATALRRHHPAPPGPPRGSTGFGRNMVILLRQRQQARSLVMRSTWATCSAAVFFLSETEAYLQSEVVAGLWENFHDWLLSSDRDHEADCTDDDGAEGEEVDQDAEDVVQGNEDDVSMAEVQGNEQDDPWLEGQPTHHTRTHGTQSGRGRGTTIGISRVQSRVQSRAQSRAPSRAASGSRPASRPASRRSNRANRYNVKTAPTTLDPQSISVAHRVYLRALAKSLFLTQPSFTDALYNLLVNVDQLVALIHSLQATWAAMDLEEDSGVVDAFVDLGKEEGETRGSLRAVEETVRRSMQEVVAALRALEADSSFMADIENDGMAGAMMDSENGVVEESEYVPGRVGGISHLLMKMDFGSWFVAEGEIQGDGDDSMEL